MRRIVLSLSITCMLALPAAKAAQLDGVNFPDTMEVAGRRLVLNGLALRTYSMLRIHVYVAALYLERRSSDGEAILNSPEDKVLVFRFSRTIGADAARKSWREAFQDSCPAPCAFFPEPITRFIDSVPGVREGDVSMLRFTPQALDISMNGRSLGQITDRNFARLVLSTFIGEHPTAPAVKREMLGMAE